MTNIEVAQPRKFTLEELYSETQIQARIAEMATEVIDVYKDEDALFVSLMKGAVPTTSALMFEIARQTAERPPIFHPVVDFMIVSTYRNETVAGEPRLILDLAPKVHVKDRKVVMIDDLRHTGTTARFTDQHLRNRGAAEVDFIVLVQRDIPNAVYPDATIAGFVTKEKRWLTGMGMDNAAECDEANRWMGSVAIVNFEDELNAA